MYPAANPQVPPATVPSHIQFLDTTSLMCAAKKEMPNNVWEKVFIRSFLRFSVEKNPCGTECCSGAESPQHCHSNNYLYVVFSRFSFFPLTEGLKNKNKNTSQHLKYQHLFLQIYFFTYTNLQRQKDAFASS